MENSNIPNIRKSRLKDYSPTWQTRQTDPSRAFAPESKVAQQLPSATQASGYDQNKQEAPPVASPERDERPQGVALTDFTPTLRLPRVSLRSRVAAVKNRRLLLMKAGLCVAVLLVAGGLYAWIRVKSLPAAVTAYQVEAHSFTQDIGGGGIVYPLQEEDISYPIAERALAVLVAPGDHVSANQPLIRLDLAQLNAQIDQAKDDVATAQAFLATVKVTGNAVEIAQAQQTYEFAENKYSALLAEVSSSTLHNGTAISTISGIVTSLYITPGEIFAANKTMIVIMDESTVIVRAEIPLTYLEQVQPGQSATVTPSSLSNLSFTGKISAIIPQADSQTDTFEVWITVANPQQSLLSGMSVFVHIQGAQSTGHALGVPRLAVLNPDREGIVFVVRNQRAYIQKVHIVGRSIDTIYIDGGISAGDKVVLVGLDTLQNGQQVRVTSVKS